MLRDEFNVNFKTNFYIYICIYNIHTKIWGEHGIYSNHRQHMHHFEQALNNLHIISV